MTPNRFQPGFTPDCTKSETIAGWVYLCIHMFIFPLALGTIQLNFFPELSAAAANVGYYGISLVVTCLFAGRLLRREFDHLCDRPWQCIKGVLLGYGLWYALGVLVTSLMMTMGLDGTTPNDQAVDLMAGESWNLTLMMSVVMAPIVEEVLFRGVVFQSLRRKNRAAAYVATIFLFGLYHVWQFAYIYQDLTYLLYIIQYIPITFALTWSYEYSGSLWTPIFFHASNNYLAMMMLQYI